MKLIKLTRAMIDNGSVAEFFAESKIGNIVGFNRRDFLAENVIEIAAKYGKVILFPPAGSDVHKQFGDHIAIITMDVKDKTEKLTTVDTLSTQKELADCYSRIGELEEQLGLRGIHKLIKCEYCRKSIKPNDANETTKSKGIAHTTCILEHKISCLEDLVIKKSGLVDTWTRESQKLADESHLLRVNKSKLEKQLESTTISLNANEEKNKKNREEIDEIHILLEKIEIEEKDLTKKYDNVVMKNADYVVLIASVIDIFKKVRDLFGGRGIITSEEEFRPLPAFSMNGELRVELKDSTWGLYKRINAIMNQL